MARTLAKTDVGNGIEMKLMWDAERAEYRVQVYRGGKLQAAETYFTNDRDDAKGTMDYMIARARKENPVKTAREQHIDLLLSIRTNSINYDWDCKVEQLNSLCEHEVCLLKNAREVGVPKEHEHLYYVRAYTLVEALCIMVDGEAD